MNDHHLYVTPELRMGSSTNQILCKYLQVRDVTNQGTANLSEHSHWVRDDLPIWASKVNCQIFPIQILHLEVFPPELLQLTRERTAGERSVWEQRESTQVLVIQCKFLDQAIPETTLKCLNYMKDTGKTSKQMDKKNLKLPTALKNRVREWRLKMEEGEGTKD